MNLFPPLFYPIPWWSDSPGKHYQPFRGWMHTDGRLQVSLPPMGHYRATPPTMQLTITRRGVFADQPCQRGSGN